MSSNVHPLAWDTEFFGIGVCRIEPRDSDDLVAAIEMARRQGMTLAYLFVDPANTAVAELARTLGARLVDRKVTYVQNLTEGPLPTPDSHIKPALHVTPKLRSLAIQSGQYSRYKTDPAFSPESFVRMYHTWLERSVSGEIAKKVLVFEDKGEELGLMTLGIKNGRANIGLIAVDQAARGSGLGKHLLDAAFAGAREWGVPLIEVVTQQDNEGACRFYERHGFVPEKIEHIFHIWFDEARNTG